MRNRILASIATIASLTMNESTVVTTFVPHG